MPSDLARATPPVTRDRQRHPRLPTSDPHVHRLFNVQSSCLSSIGPGGCEVPMLDFPTPPACALCCLAAGTEPRRDRHVSNRAVFASGPSHGMLAQGSLHWGGAVCTPISRLPTRAPHLAAHNSGLDSLDQVRIMAQSRHRGVRLLAYAAGVDIIPADPQRSKPDCYQEGAEWSSSANVVAHP